MTTYMKDTGKVSRIVTAVEDKYHGPLKGAEVTYDIILAFADPEADDPPPPVRFAGYPAAAVVKINNLKSRAQGLADVLLTVDGDHWGNLTEAEQWALIDHELTHLELVTSIEGIHRDDLGRPKLKIRRHDWQIGGFDTIAARHGSNALEIQAAQKMSVYAKQLLLAGFEEESTAPIATETKVSFAINGGQMTAPISMEEFKELPAKIKAAHTAELGGHGVQRRRKPRRSAAVV